MVMKKSVVKAIVIALVIIALFIPIGMEMYANRKIATIPYSKVADLIESSNNGYGFTLVYVSPESDENAEANKEEVQEIVASYKHRSTGEPFIANFVDYDSLTDQEKIEIFGDSKEKIAYITVANGSKIRTVIGSVSNSKLGEFISADSAHDISDDLKFFKAVTTAKDYEKLFKDKKNVAMTVFGTEKCFYCGQFKVIYNKVARDYKIDINYFDILTYEKEAEKVEAMKNMIVPGKCLDSKVDTQMSEVQYGTPLTLFTKNGKVIDCIGGYVNEAELLTKLKEVGMIKE